MLVPTGIGAGATSIITLNESSRWLISELQGKEFTEDDAVAMILSRYEVDEQHAREDVSRILAVLFGCGFISK